MTRWKMAAVILIAGGCNSPDTPQTEECGPQKSCPAGLECDPVDRRCIKIVAALPDAAPPDAAPPDAAPPDAAPDAAPEGCVPGSGPTMHTGPIGDETWSAATSPHVLALDTTISGTLTLGPCAVLTIAPRRIVTVTGALRAEGTAKQPVTIASTTPGMAFAHIRTVGGTLRFVHTTIEGGGDPLNGGADLVGTLVVQGKGPTVPDQQTLFVDHLTLRGSLSNGIVLYDAGGFAAGSDALTVTGSGRYPLSTWARVAGTIPTGTYTGNGRDEILLWGMGGGEGINSSTTLRAHGLPYRVGHDQSAGELRVVAPPPTVPGVVTLTIEAGVTLRFKKGGALHVDFGFGDPQPARAALVAIGTEAAPIVFTSLAEAPAAGDWLGVYFHKIPDPGSRLDHARIEYAGGQSSGGSSSCAGSTWTDSDAAVRIFGPPDSQLVTRTAISSSAGHGIDRGWRALDKIDFLPTNSFSAVTHCLQSYPGDPTFCPAPDMVPCPK